MFNCRAWNIVLRTAHIGAMGVLLGGSAFGVDRSRLGPSLWLTIGTGLGLAALESGLGLAWFHEIRGLMTLAKLGLLCAVGVFPQYRLPLLLVVVVIASVGSHMPARFRYYSLILRTVLPCRGGPATCLSDGSGKDE